jgi:hypothetical protein
MLQSEKADVMRGALAFVKAVHNRNWHDAGYLCQVILNEHQNDPLAGFAQSMGAMATLLCNELDVTDEWVDVRLAAISYLETHDEI